MSRVENRRSGVSLPVAGDWAFAASPQSGLAWLCFLFPLIEPDRRMSRIRLSEKGSRFRPRKAACPSSKFDKAQHLMQGGNWKLLSCLPSQLVLGTQPVLITVSWAMRVLFRPVSWLIASQMRCTRCFDGVVPR